MVSNRTPTGRDWRGVAAFLLLELLGLLLYAKTLAYGPVWDDHFFLAEPLLRDCANLAKVLDPRTLYRVLPVTNSARPAWLASVVADACLSREWFVGYRVTSVFWHSSGAAVLMCLAWQLAGDGAAGAFAALLFLVHPVHTEAVNIINFRSELMALALGLLSLSFYLAARDEEPKARRAGYGAAFFCAAAALLSKETAVTLPLLVILADRLFPPKKKRSRWPVYAGYAALVVLYLIFRIPRSGYVMEGHEDIFSSVRQVSPAFVDAISKGAGVARPVPAAMEPPPFGEDVLAKPKVRLLTMSRVFLSYLRLLFWPWPLQGDYAPRPVYSWLDGGVWLSWLAWLAVFAAAWKLRRRRPLAAFGLAWMGAALLPVSGLVALKNLEAERYVYASSAGLALAAGSGWSWLWAARARWARPLALAGGLAVLAAFAVLTQQRNLAYVSDAAFFEKTVEADPSVPRAHFNLAQEYRYEGRPELAEREFKAGLALAPRSLNGRLLYARFLVDVRRPAEASEQLRAAESLHPGSEAVRREAARLAQAVSPSRKPRP